MPCHLSAIGIIDRKEWADSVNVKRGRGWVSSGMVIIYYTCTLLLSLGELSKKPHYSYRVPALNLLMEKLESG